MNNNRSQFKGHRSFGRRGQRGFTLVELVIVGALLAIFSSIAVFGVQQQYRSNIRKVAIAETRQIGAALEFANIDTSVFPRLCWLSESESGLTFISQQIVGGPAAVPIVFAALDINSRTISATGAASARSNWKGPYLGLSQNRVGAAQGRGGFVYMIQPELPTGAGSENPNSLVVGNGIRWPADPYSNPYVVYMLDVDLTTNPAQPSLAFVNDNVAGQGTNRKGSFVNAVVSYGPNQYPGGVESPLPTFGTGVRDQADEGIFPWNMRLYRGLPGFKPSSKNLPTHTYRAAAEFRIATDPNARARANMWGRGFATTANGIPAGTVAITDLTSDDLVFEF